MQYNYDLITITLNSAKTLPRTLDSVAKQIKMPARYIFIDADSQDGTLNLIENFKKAHPNIEVIIEQQSGKGISQAWNQALTHVKSELVCILNSDDWWELDAMKKVLENFERTPELQILSGAIKYHSDHEQALLMPAKPAWQMPWRMCFMHPATFVKKEVYDQIGGFNESYKCSMDYDFMFRAIKAGIKIKTTNEIFTHMLAGGQANSTRDLAREETKEIANANGHKIIPGIAYLFRQFSGR